MKLPPLNSLKAFEASARCGSFVLAAEELCVTAAAVSMQVRKLEQFFGKTLFTRGHNHIALTDAGMVIYRDSASALNQISALTAKLLGDRDHRPLCVSVLPALAERWLAPRRLSENKLTYCGGDILAKFAPQFRPIEQLLPSIGEKI